MTPSEQLAKRIEEHPKGGWLTVLSTLHHLSIITFAVEYDKMRKSIPGKYEIYSIELEGKKYGLVSAVTFLNKNFRYKRIFPFLKFSFYQTNYRAYVIDPSTKENIGWFYGTSLGSIFAIIPKLCWKMPWLFSKYQGKFDHSSGKYETYKIEIKSEKNNAQIDLTETDNLQLSSIGFPSLEEAKLVLTHPIVGDFLRKDGELATYQIRHPEMPVRNGKVTQCYFEKFEELGLLTREEMEKPYSVLLTDKIPYTIYLPPHPIER